MRKQLTNKSLVPVAYQVRMSDGRWGTIFHHPDKPLGDHRPLYAHPPQPSEAVAEDVLDAANNYLTDQYGLSALGHPVDRQRILRALKGDA